MKKDLNTVTGTSKTICFAGILGIAFVFAQVTDVSAALSLTNPSFESPDISPDSFNLQIPTNWTMIDPDPETSSRMFNQGDGAPGTGFIGPGATGDQVAVIAGGKFVSSPGFGAGTDLFQNIGTTPFGDANVTLKVDAAIRKDGTSGSVPAIGFTMGLWRDTNADSVPDLALATFSVSDVTLFGQAGVGTFQQFSVTAFTVPNGTELYARFTANDASDQLRQTLLDNVQIVVVPEPSAMALLVAGGMLLAWRTRGRSS